MWRTASMMGRSLARGMLPKTPCTGAVLAAAAARGSAAQTTAPPAVRVMSTLSSLGGLGRIPASRMWTRGLGGGPSSGLTVSASVRGVQRMPSMQAMMGSRAMSSAAPRTASKASQGAGRSTGVRNWLVGSAGLVYGMIVLGGVTRLTESGLSMTTWSVTGSLPPMSRAAWEEEFDKYKASPEYELLNAGMTVEEFKGIFWFEYTHRMLGRLIGAAFVLPLGYFWARGALSPLLKKQALAITAMIGGQGALGWYMVKSGLGGEYDPESKAPPRVSQYRLAAHLSSALVIYSSMVWALFDVILPKASAMDVKALAPRALSVLRNKSMALTGILGLTIVSGAFVAGMDAGLVYNEFPLMGGAIVPSDYFHPDKSLLRNMLENESAAQFNHRTLGLTTTAGVLAMWSYARKLPLPARIRTAINAAAGVVVFQTTMGISTLLMYVPVSLAAVHQAGSVALLTSLLWVARLLRHVKP